MLSPLPIEAWSYQHAAHLLNRAGFGGARHEIEALHALGLEGAVESLLAGARGDAATLKTREPPPAYARPRNLEQERRERQKLELEARNNARRQQQRRDQQQYLQMTGEWLEQMQMGKSPLREKLALFWHGHFATSQAKVRPAYYLWTQKETFRHKALADIPTLVKAMVRDPAMLLWLDGESSRAHKPNENFSREVMELFTLGEGNYTEQDVAEAARAFTGYRINPADQSFRFAPLQHDDGEKLVLGQRGRWTGEDVAGILCSQPACARFMASKFIRFFVSDTPSPLWVEALASVLMKSKMAVEPMLRQLFLSAAFYEERQQQIKAPVEWLVQCLKTLEIPPLKYNQARNVLQQLGQMLYRPPNVKGWEGGKSWITTSSLLARYNIAGQLVGALPMEGRQGRQGRRRGERQELGLLRSVPEEALTSEVALVEFFSQALFQAPCEAEARDRYCDFLKEKPLESGAIRRQLLHLMMSTPEYQLI